jgi:DNA invertase Pin-like site-specific DNA recombinase
MDEPKKTKIALYARVSTLLNQDPENQLIHLRSFAKARGFEVVAELVDKGISGAKERRPALDELRQSALKGEFQLIGVAALDRLGRNTKHLLILIDELKHCSVSIISLREGIDFSSPIGQATLTIISAISQLERNLISERIKNALAAKKMAAEQSGSGWRCGRETVVTEELIKQVKELRGQGVSIRKIAK